MRVLIVDDHPLVREGLRATIGRESGIEIVGEAVDGREAVKLAVELSPDVVLMDLNLPGMDGLEATRVITKHQPESKILIISVSDDVSTVGEGIRAGAHGFVAKDRPAQEVLRAIHCLSQGRACFDVDIIRQLVGSLPTPARPALASLTPREVEVLTLIAEGLTNKRIAGRLGLSVRTIQTHREHIMQKLDIHTAAGLTRYAVSKGLVDKQP